MVDSRLTKLKDLDSRSPNGSVVGLYLCSCGKTKEIVNASVRARLTKSCGCLRVEVATTFKTTHGFAGKNRTPEYAVWKSMRMRCNNPADGNYYRYGGRGIAVCARWSNYPTFIADMGCRPSSAHSIDRIDVNGNYEPNNCRWATMSEQARNKRSTRNITAGGLTLPAIDWAEKLGKPVNTLYSRIRMGWSDEEIVNGRSYGGKTTKNGNIATSKRAKRTRSLKWLERTEEEDK